MKESQTCKYEKIFCILLLKEQFDKYVILKVSERVRANLKQPEVAVQ